MLEYIFIPVWIGVCGLFSAASGGKLYKTEKILDQNVQRMQVWFAVLAFAPIVYFAATRGFFADTTAYIIGFLESPSSFSELPEYCKELQKDKGYYILAALIHIVFKDNYVVYLFIIALIQSISLIAVFRKYSTNYLFSILLFVLSTDYISWMYNGIRQFTAVALVFAASSLMIKKRYTSVILVVLFASLFHQSALIMIPLIFLSYGRAWNKKTIFFILVALIAVFFVDSFTDILDSSLQDTQYKNVVSDYTSFNDDGTNPLRVLVYSVPAIISFFCRKYIRESDDKIINFCTNMSIISTGIYLVSMVTSGIFIGRIPIYCSLYSYILLPWEIQTLFSKNSKLLIYLLSIIFYSLFYWYSITH